MDLQQPPNSPSTSNLQGEGSFKSKKCQQKSTGCENPFVPAGGGTSFTRFRQLSTRRNQPPKPSPNKQRTVSSPSLGSPPPAFAPDAADDRASSPGLQGLPLNEELWMQPPFVVSPPPPNKSSGVSAPVHRCPNGKPTNNNNTTVVSSSSSVGLGFTVNPGVQPKPTEHKTPMMGYTLVPPDGHNLDPSEWTIVDKTEDHPGRRKASGFLQPIKHLSGKRRIKGSLMKVLAVLGKGWPRRFEQSDLSRAARATKSNC
jgi:hypothetical protein